MIITRTPLRISLGGGGTDLPYYYESSGHGFLIAAAITKHIYIAINKNFEEDFLLKYSSVERVSNVNSIEHPLLRECLKRFGVAGSIEVSSMADIPAGTGLGSSGSFGVGLLKALGLYTHSYESNIDIAAEACRIEIDVLGEPVGKQDQYITALGGIQALTFSADGRVTAEALNLDVLTRSRLEENLLLFFTGVRRSASDVLSSESASKSELQADLLENLNQTRAMGYQTRDVIESGDLESFGELLTEQWHLKYQRQPSDLHDEVNHWITSGIKAGATGGKLVGAGGGGFLLFYAERKAELRKVMADLGLEEVAFRIDYEGSSILVAR